MRGLSRHIGRLPHLGLPGVPSLPGVAMPRQIGGSDFAGHPVKPKAERRDEMPKTQQGIGLVGAIRAAWFKNPDGNLIGAPQFDDPGPATDNAGQQVDGIARDEVKSGTSWPRATCILSNDRLFPLGDADIDSESHQLFERCAEPLPISKMGFAERGRADSQEHHL